MAALAKTSQSPVNSPPKTNILLYFRIVILLSFFVSLPEGLATFTEERQHVAVADTGRSALYSVL
jgi:hypothetical protein